MTKGAGKWLFISVLNSYLSAVCYIASLLLIAFALRTILIGQATLLIELAAFFVLILLIIARMWTNSRMVGYAARYSNRARSILRRALYKKVTGQDIKSRALFSTSEHQ